MTKKTSWQYEKDSRNKKYKGKIYNSNRWAPTSGFIHSVDNETGEHVFTYWEKVKRDSKKIKTETKEVGRHRYRWEALNIAQGR